jgi:hypothetical protein
LFKNKYEVVVGYRGYFDPEFNIEAGKVYLDNSRYTFWTASATTQAERLKDLIDRVAEDHGDVKSPILSAGDVATWYNPNRTVRSNLSHVESDVRKFVKSVAWDLAQEVLLEATGAKLASAGGSAAIQVAPQAASNAAGGLSAFLLWLRNRRAAKAASKLDPADAAALGKLVGESPVKGIAGTRGLQHSFDRHAAEWFARHGGTPTLTKWQELLETASKSTKVVEWSTGADKTIGKLARIDGNKWFFVQFFKEGPRAGEIATAFIPNKDQLRAILELLGK